MRVLVAGAHGKTARRLVRTLVGNGHEVRGLVRKEEQLADVEADGAEPVLVDLENDEADGSVGEAVAGCDAVVFAAGAGPGSGEARKETMDYGGAAKLVEAAEKNGAGRYLMLSSVGAGDPEAGPEAMRPYLRAKAKAVATSSRGISPRRPRPSAASTSPVPSSSVRLPGRMMVQSSPLSLSRPSAFALARR